MTEEPKKEAQTFEHKVGVIAMFIATFSLAAFCAGVFLSAGVALGKWLFGV